MFSKLKQFKDLKDQGKKLQEVLGGETATASNFGNSVSITMDGNMKITEIKISPDMLTPDKKEKLESALKDVHEDVLKKVQRIIAGKMQESGFSLPGLGK